MTGLRQGIAKRTRMLATLADPTDTDGLLALLRILYATGRNDLPLGRVFEGHVDALQIVHRYGTDAQQGAIAAAVEAGAALGVWNADLPDDGLHLEGVALTGGKSFASGAGVLSHALVTVAGDGGRQLILVDLARTSPLIDHDFWRVVGMQRSETHIVRWDGAPVERGDLIGAPGDYVREPWFSGGAIRFAAVQAGGIAAIVDQVTAHLIKTERAADPHQSGRLAMLYGLAEAAAGSVRTAAVGWFATPESRLALVAAARGAVYEAGGRAIGLAQEAIGLQSLFVDHPLSKTMADLSVYLRQPGPDAQRMIVGAAVAHGLLRPDL